MASFTIGFSQDPCGLSLLGSSSSIISSSFISFRILCNTCACVLLSFALFAVMALINIGNLVALLNPLSFPLVVIDH